jgi:hypothetical protein
VTSLEEKTPAQRTRFLSKEIAIGLVVQFLLIASGGTYAYGKLEAKVDSQVEPEKVTTLQRQVAILESKAVDGNRITKLEAQMTSLEASMMRLQTTIDREVIRRERQ